MLTLTPDDISAIADEIEARFDLRERLVTTQAEIAMVDAAGIDPVKYLKDKRLMELRQAGYEIGKASKGQSKRRTKKSATTTASTETSKGARKTTDV